MSVDGYDINLDSEAPRLTAALLRADAWIAGFFGADGIREHDDSEVAAWSPIPPYVAVLPGPLREQRTSGMGMYVTAGVRFLVYLPAVAPTVPSIVSPGSPTVTLDGTGVLTGARMYAATACTATGESCVDDGTGIVAMSTPIVYAAQKGAVVMPWHASATTLRLWATRLDGKALFFHSFAAPGATVVDNTPDASLSLEMAPIRYMGRRITSAMKQALIAGDGLGGKAFKALTIEDGASRVENGVRVHEFTAYVPMRGDVSTRRSTV